MPCVCDVETSYVQQVVRDHSFNSTHMSCNLRILYKLSVMIQKQFFRVFHLFASGAPEVKHFHKKHTSKNSQIILNW